MHAHINKCSVKRGLMPVKDPHESFFFFFSIFFFFYGVHCGLWAEGVYDVGKHDH